MEPGYILWGFGILSGCCMAAEYRRHRKKLLPGLLVGTGGGIAALLTAVRLGFLPPVTAGTAGFAALLGIPGVLFLCAVHFWGWI